MGRDRQSAGAGRPIVAEPRAELLGKTDDLDPLPTYTLRIKLRSGNWHYLLCRGGDVTLDSEEALVVTPEGLAQPQRAEAGTGLRALASRLAERLDHIDARLGGEGNRRAGFWWLFSDGHLMRPAAYTDFLSLDPGEWSLGSEEALAAAGVFYKGVYLFLSAGDRYQGMEAWLARLYAGWQWYNCIKRLTGGRDEQDEHDESTVRRREVWLDELAAAHRALSALLEDAQFAGALRWLAKWSSAYFNSGPLLREQLQLSLPLWKYPRDEVAAHVEADKPLPAPGCLVENRPHWSQTRLHPVFATVPGAQTSVRRLVTESLLPRYNFGTVWRLARLLRVNRPQVDRPRSAWLLAGGVAAWGLLIAAVSMALWGTWATGGGGWPAVLCAALEMLLGPVLLFVFAVTYFDTRLLAHLALPRLVSGILLGYLAVIVQNDAVKLALVFWRYGPGLVFLEWGAVLGLSFLYLFFDVRPLVREGREACWRAVVILFLAIALTALVGFAAVALTTAAYPDPDGFAFAQTGYWLGPFGWIDWRQWVALIPLAMFTGLVTQFIFEERTVTAPVWMPDQE